MPALLGSLDAKEEGEIMTDTIKPRETPKLSEELRREAMYPPISALHLKKLSQDALNLERQRDELVEALRMSRDFVLFSQRDNSYARVQANDALLAKIEGERK